MLFFPQLSTGAVAQYPAARERIVRTVLAETGSGARTKLADAGATRAEWLLRWSDLSENEAAALEGLFENTEGRLRPFVFLDPLANLLAWSESFGAAVWQRPSQLQLTAGIADPFGTTRASRLVNASAAPAALSQEISGPGNYRYAFSVWVRSTGAAVTLRRVSGALSISEEHQATSTWRRIVLRCGPGPSPTTPVRFEIELAPGASMDLFGAQAEAQPNAGAYKRTGAEGGVHDAANFAQDVLVVDAEGPDRYSTSVRIAVNKEI